MQPSYDVVICGLGPVGGVLANLLGQAGLRVAVAEKGSDPYHLPRAVRYDHEVMRVLQRLGLHERMLPHVTVSPGMQFLGLDGGYICGYRSTEHPAASGWPFSYLFYQPTLEGFLRDGLNRFPNVMVMTDAEVTSVDQRRDHADVSFTRGGGEAGRLRASYVVGCDGARSTIRDHMDATIDDWGFDEPWLVVDVALRRSVDGLPPITTQFCDPARPTTFLPGTGHHRRWEWRLLPGESAADFAASERVWELLAPWGGPEDFELIRAAVYTFHAVLVHGWRDGRLFLAGDAAHQTPPFLAQGLCGGIRDAANLAWKLTAVLRGEADPVLLDTYEKERGRHFATVMRHAVRAGRIVSTLDRQEAGARDSSFRASLARGVDPLSEYRIPGLEDGLIADQAVVGRGEIFPQGLVRGPDGKQRRFDEVAGYGWLLVSATEPGQDVREAATAADVRVLVVGDDLEPADARLSDWLDAHGTTVVRPDHYVYGTAADKVSLVAMLDGLHARLHPDAAVSRS